MCRGVSEKAKAGVYAVLTAALVAVSFFASPAHAAAHKLTLLPGAELSIEGKSTVRDFTCRATEVKADVELNEGASTLSLTELASTVRQVRLDIAAPSLDCANPTMNEHMRKALEVEKHQTIALQITRYEVGAAVDGVAPMKLYADLTLHGVTRPVTIVAQARVSSDGTLVVDGRYALRMTDWGVTPPSLMLGTMKVRESVVIRFQLSMKQ